MDRRFAKVPVFCYYVIMSALTSEETITLPNTLPESTPEAPALVLTIKDEEQFHERIEAEKEKHASHAAYGDFSNLADSLHGLLKQQNSDAALSLITRGALGLGSSDIHYDTTETDIGIRLRIDGDLVTITTLTK